MMSCTFHTFNFTPQNTYHNSCILEPGAMHLPQGGCDAREQLGILWKQFRLVFQATIQLNILCFFLVTDTISSDEKCGRNYTWMKNIRFLRFWYLLYYSIISRLIWRSDDEAIKAKLREIATEQFWRGLRVSALESDINESSSVENLIACNGTKHWSVSQRLDGVNPAAVFRSRERDSAHLNQARTIALINQQDSTENAIRDLKPLVLFFTLIR